MTVPASGTIKLSDIISTFGSGGSPKNLRAYLRGAGIVTNVNIPTSGTLGLRQFAGLSADITLTLVAGSVSNGSGNDYGTVGTFSLTPSTFTLNGTTYTLTNLYTNYVLGSYQLVLELTGPSVVPQNAFTNISFIDHLGTTQTFTSAAASYNQFASTTSDFLWSAGANQMFNPSATYLIHIT